MKEKLITFKIAKLAKEKKFDWLTRYYFSQINSEPFETHENSLDDYNSSHWNEENGEWISRPTQSLLQKWLREIHNIQINIENYHSIKEEKPYSVYIEYIINGHWTYKDFDEINDYDTYEEALEKGLQEGLKLINIEII
jgi:hypothetical protein